MSQQAQIKRDASGNITELKLHNVKIPEIEVISDKPSFSQSGMVQMIAGVFGDTLTKDILLRVSDGKNNYFVPLRSVESLFGVESYSLGNTYYENDFNAAMQFNPVKWKRDYKEEINYFFNRRFDRR